MPSRRPWFRLYTAFRTDPRVQSLGAEYRAAFVNLLCLAGESTQPGYIEESDGKPYGAKALAKAINVHPAALDRIINTLIEHDVGGLTRLEGGGLLMSKWGSNQPVDPSAQERMLRYRARLQERNTIVTVTGESRVEKSRIRVEKSTPLPPAGDTTPKKAPPVYPEWFEPITRLPGFLHANHARAIDAIITACEAHDINPGALMLEFAAYWPRGRLPTSQGGHGWTNPIRALIKTLDIQIAKHLRGGTNGADRRHNQGDYPSPAHIPGSEHTIPDSDYPAWVPLPSRVGL